MATVTVKPNGDGTVHGTWAAIGGAGSRHASVSHGTSSPDDTEYVYNGMNEGDSNEFMYSMEADEIDGGMLTFTATHPKWSFAKLDSDGFVTEVAEKKPISDIATTGIYYWKKGSDYVKYAEQMIENNTRVNNEFYVCPVFNEAIANGKKIKTFHFDGMWGIGTPEDLRNFLENHK